MNKGGHRAVALLKNQRIRGITKKFPVRAAPIKRGGAWLFKGKACRCGSYIRLCRAYDSHKGR